MKNMKNHISVPFFKSTTTLIQFALMYCHCSCICCMEALSACFFSARGRKCNLKILIIMSPEILFSELLIFLSLPGFSGSLHSFTQYLQYKADKQFYSYKNLRFNMSCKRKSSLQLCKSTACTFYHSMMRITLSLHILTSSNLLLHMLKAHIYSIL